MNSNSESMNSKTDIMISKTKLTDAIQKPLKNLSAEEFGNLFYKLFEEDNICKRAGVSRENLAKKFGCAADELDRRVEDTTGLTLDMIMMLYRSQP